MPTRGGSLERANERLARDRYTELLELGRADALGGSHGGGAQPPPHGEVRQLLARVVTPANAVAASWVVNIFLLAAKVVAFVATNSKAVLASLADSAGALRSPEYASAHERHLTRFAVDLCSQMILSLADRYVKRADARYPVGRCGGSNNRPPPSRARSARLEALGVLGCACIMSSTPCFPILPLLHFPLQWPPLR